MECLNESISSLKVVHRLNFELLLDLNDLNHLIKVPIIGIGQILFPITDVIIEKLITVDPVYEGA